MSTAKKCMRKSSEILRETSVSLQSLTLTLTPHPLPDDRTVRLNIEVDSLSQHPKQV